MFNNGRCPLLCHRKRGFQILRSSSHRIRQGVRAGVLQNLRLQKKVRKMK
jgi:hypothetical protein